MNSLEQVKTELTGLKTWDYCLTAIDVIWILILFVLWFKRVGLPGIRAWLEQGPPPPPNGGAPQGDLLGLDP